MINSIHEVVSTLGTCGFCGDILVDTAAASAETIKHVINDLG